jgi:hypothetical protein
MFKPLFIFSLVSLFTFTACNTYTVLVEPNPQSNASACPHPTYVATMSKSAKSKVVSSVPTSTGETKNTTVNSIEQENITLFNLLADARTQYGNDVTIQNIRWDMKNKKRLSVIYDVIRCK